jgi:hypothetical protein
MGDMVEALLKNQKELLSAGVDNERELRQGR